MPRLSKQQVASMREDRESGMSINDIMEKYNVSKRAVYYNTNDKHKNDNFNVDDLEPEYHGDIENIEEQRRVTFDLTDVEEDPLLDFAKANKEVPTMASVNDDRIFHIKDDIDDVFNIDNILAATKPDIPEEPKLSVSKLINGIKGKKTNQSSEMNKTPEQIEEIRLKLVYQVRLYLYTFKDCENLFLALNVEQNDKKINKFIQDLYRRKEVELTKLLHFIKFHIRHNNNMIQGNFVSGVFFSVVKIFELVLYKIGIDITGLSDDLRNDKDIISNLKEIEIEMTAGKLNVGPKVDVMFKLCQAGLGKFTQNKLLSKMKDASKTERLKDIAGKLQSKPLNEELQEKYKDI